MNMTTRRLAVATAAGLACLGLAAPSAAANSGGVPSTSGWGYAYYEDDGDYVRACDYRPSDGYQTRVVLSVRQADGSWIAKAPVTSNSGCNQQHRDVQRESAQVRLEVCDMLGSTGMAFSCAWAYING